MNSKLICIFGIFSFAMQTGASEDEVANSIPEGSMADFCADLPRPEYDNFNELENDSNWFELYQLAPGVTAIYEPHQWQEVISYLIEGEEEALLFDTGNGIADIKLIIDQLTDKPVSVLNSHTHYDHVGGNFAFEKILGMDADFTRKRQTGHSNNEIAVEVSPVALCNDLPAGVTEKNHVGRPFMVTQFIQDGHIIDLGNRKLEVIQLPGHTPDAIALIDRMAGLLWTGDSYYSGPIWLFAPETDLSAYAKSLDRLIQEVPNVKAVLPAHNTPWVDPAVLPRVADAFELLISGQTERVDQGNGMIEHRIAGENQFSFLLRDEPVPYTN